MPWRCAGHEKSAGNRGEVRGQTGGAGRVYQKGLFNGRMDLSQAEAVIDVINAKNEYALKSSLGQLKGNIQKAIQEIRERIIYQIAYIESALDDPEHISIDGYGETLGKEVELLKEDCSSFCRRYGKGN